MVGRKKLAEQTRGTSGAVQPRRLRGGRDVSGREAGMLTLLARRRPGTEFKKVAEEEKGPAFKTLLKGKLLRGCSSLRDDR